MNSVLIIGLNILSKNIIDCLKATNYKIFGFDFDVDKINSYHHNGLILNSSEILLNDIIKESEVIIMNIEFSKYENIFQFVPFMKNDCLIINTNICKENTEKIKKMLNNKQDNFIPCNFLLFPKNIVINYDKNTKMNAIMKVSTFFKSINIKTSVLNPKINDEIFAKLFQIPYLLENTVFKSTGLHFANNNAEYIKYNFFIEDILANKATILNGLEEIIKNLIDLSDTENIFNLLDKNNSKCIEISTNIENAITDEIVVKIIFEKIFIKHFLTRENEEFCDSNLLNFDYPKYDNENVKKYIKDNRANIGISAMIVKEKIINLSSFLQFDDMPLNKFTKYIIGSQ